MNILNTLWRYPVCRVHVGDLMFHIRSSERIYTKPSTVEVSAYTKETVLYIIEVSLILFHIGKV